MSHYNSSGNLLKRSITTYQRTTVGTDLTFGIAFDYNNNSYQFQKYPILATVGNVIATQSDRSYVSTDSSNYVESLTTFVYNAAQLQKKIIIATSLDTTTVRQTINYPKDYATTGTDTQGRIINQLVSANRHATPVEMVSYRGNTVTGATLTLFNDNFGSSIVRPWQQLVFGDTTGFTPSAVSGSNFTYANTKYLAAVTFDAYDSVGTPTIAHNCDGHGLDTNTGELIHEEPDDNTTSDGERSRVYFCLS